MLRPKQLTFRQLRLFNLDDKFCLGEHFSCARYYLRPCIDVVSIRATAADTSPGLDQNLVASPGQRPNTFRAQAYPAFQNLNFLWDTNMHQA